MKKSLRKRIKITKKGKIKRRAMGIDHFRTSKEKKSLKRKKKTRSLAVSRKKLLNY